MQPPDATLLPFVPATSAFPDEITFCDLVTDAKPGTEIVYHIGHLAFDRTLTAKVLPERRRKELGAVANRALQLAEARLVHLVQRRVGEMCCEYIAVVRPRPRHAIASLVHTATQVYQQRFAAADIDRLGSAA